MKKLILWVFFSLIATKSFAQKVMIETSEGNIVIRLFPKKAPITVANFLRYVDEQKYNNASFYRAVTLENQQPSPIKIQVIQGGVLNDTINIHQPIPLETTQKTGLTHKVGAISMARGNPNSATTEFFICLGSNQPQLDFGGKRNPDLQGYAVFGQVTKGMNVVKKIQQKETVLWSANQQKQWLKEAVKIIRIKRI